MYVNSAGGRDARYYGLLGLLLFLVYMLNFRLFVDPDTIPAMLLPVALTRGDGLFLDRFSGGLPGSPLPGERLPYVFAEARGHVLSRYPVAPALLAVPVVLPQVILLDRLRPGWDRDQGEGIVWCAVMAKVASATIAAGAAVALFDLLCALGLTRVALPATLAAALGSSLWTVASQSLWQHGPAALALILSMRLLIPHPASRARLFWAGGATAALVALRATDVVFAVATLLYVARHRKHGLAWFLVMPILISATLVGYNVWFFGDIAGGQSQLESLHRIVHEESGPWSGKLLAGMAGTLVSPSRGLFIFSPWTALALAALPAIASNLRPWPHLRYLLWSLVPYLLLLSKYAVWWGGHCFGPRYWTDAMPLFAILLAFGLDRAWTDHRPALIAFAVAIVFSAAVQALGAFRYTHSWDLVPADVDQHHERLWDWRDSVLIRCLREGPTGIR
jgi:hypothetical protein